MSTRIPRRPRRLRIPARRVPGRRGGMLRIVLLVVVLIVVLVAAAGAWFASELRDGTPTVDSQRGIESLRADLEREIAARQVAEEALRRAEQQLAIQSAEVAAFAGDIERQEAELLMLRDELAFYEHLAEGSRGDALGIRALQVQRTGQAGVFDVGFQLYRPGVDRSVDLEWTLQVEGVPAGEEDVVTLEADALGLDSSRLVEDLRLVRNQRVRIRLPEDFEPRRLTLRASAEDDEDLEPVSERADWDRLLEMMQ